jgi:hypothetical protein
LHLRLTLPSALRPSAVSLAWPAALATGCSGASPAPAPTARPPAPFVLQYAGEYDGTGGVGSIVLHVNGTFDATIDGQSARGVYDGPASPGDVSLSLRTDDGRTFALALRAGEPSSSVAPPQVLADITRADGTTETLASPWVAGNEGMCWATDGRWHRDPDPQTGLSCDCDRDDVYLPSRGGCVARRIDGRDGDPPRLPLSYEARRRAGIFDGGKRISSITLATDGRYRATIDGQVEEGTWWDATYLPSRDEDSGADIACTSALHAFAATLEQDGTLTVRWSDSESEWLRRP